MRASLVAFLMACALPLGALAGEAPVQADQGVAKAVWKSQQLDFFYTSFTTFYTCDGLRGRLRKLLVAAGARAKDLKIQVNGCDAFDAPTRSPFVRIEFTSPVEATAKNIADIEKDRATRELKARVRNEKPESNEPFDAYWKNVSFSRGKLDIEPGECELIEQLNKKVFPKMGVRVLKQDVNCTPNQTSLGQPRLEVQALTRAPKAEDQKPAEKKGSEKG
jgi:hypothetical protein